MNDDAPPRDEDAPVGDSGWRARLAPLRAVGAGANGLVDDLTPGQRWTAALALLLSVLVLSFGLPTETVVRRGSAEAARRRPAAASSDQAAAAPAPPLPPLPAGVSFEDVPDSSAAPITPAEPSDAPGPAAPTARPAKPAIVAVVRSGDSLPMRDDAAIAAAFLDNARFDATVVPLSDDPALCETIVGAGQVVIASHGLPPDVQDCLLARRVTVVAYDALGDRPPSPGSGQVLSTRRGDRASLGDLGRWAQRTGALAAAPGLVVSEPYRVEVDAAISDLGELGIQFRQVAYIPGGAAQGPAVLSAVQAFADAGVETVLFAANVEDQSRWVQVQQLMGGGVKYVVSDVGDGVVNEGYPSFFGDAVAHTSLASPWRERTEAGETPQQTECREHWEDAAPPGPAPGGELVVAFLWCQHVRFIVEPALDLVDTGVPFEEAVRRLVVESPLTSQLGSLGETRWGPRLDVALTWDGGCGCWAPQGGFVGR